MAPLLSSSNQGVIKLLNRVPSTPTLKDPPELVNRQAAPTATITVVAADVNSGGTNLSGGAIAGIVIGSIAGFLLLLWILRSCFNLGAPPQEGGTEKWYRDPPRRRHRHRSHSIRRSSSLSVPPPVIIHESKSRSRRSYSPSYTYSESSRGRRSHRPR